MQRSVFLMLIFNLSVGFSAETKRPSWSEGLPEQKAVPVTITSKINKPEHSLDADDMQAEQAEIGFDASTFETGVLVPIELTTLNQDHQINLPAEHNEQETRLTGGPDEAKHTAVVTDVEGKQLVQSRSKNSDSYSWHITRQFPIKVSAVSQPKQSSLLVKVMINNQGEIVAVEKVLDDTPTNLIQIVKRSLKRWKFSSPEKEGIDVPYLSRVLKVALTAR